MTNVPILLMPIALEGSIVDHTGLTPLAVKLLSLIGGFKFIVNFVEVVERKIVALDCMLMHL